MGLVGCYSMQLFCDHPECMDRWNYGAPAWENDPWVQTEGQSIRDARKDGWLITKKREGDGYGIGYCLCPKHSGKKRNK